MNALLAASASFVLVFFTALIVVGVLYGILLATEELIAWIVLPAQQPEPHVAAYQDEASPSRE